MTHESARLELGGLRVTFARQGDRFAHAIALVDRQPSVVLLESIEGLPDEAWPAAPPIQELHVEDRGSQGHLVLMVGMAGRSHWSVSAAVEAERRRIVFDVACRLRELPTRLASSYRLAGAARLEPTSDGGAPIRTVRVVGSGSSLLVAALAIENAEAQSAVVSADDVRRFAILPADLPAKLPATIRWRYAISQGSLV